MARVGSLVLKDFFERGYTDDLYRLGHYLLDFVIYISEKQRMEYGCTKIVTVLDLNGFAFANAFNFQCKTNLRWP